MGDADCIVVLQGGGALGAYQAGMFEALSQHGREPDWVAGISIGAINAALIAGNAPRDRVAQLRRFWERVSAPNPGFAWPPEGVQEAWGAARRFLGGTTPGLPGATQFFAPREALNESSAAQVMLFGASGFFAPRVPPAPWQPRGTPGAISFYDTAPLRETLDELVDFDRINARGAMRLSVGAVNVRSGNFAYFDSRQQRIDVRHIMASGALPPGFAPVEIEGKFYWDGGLVSNTPLQYVLDQPCSRHRVIFQADLFAASGEMPTTLAEVGEREKDIRFSSRTRLNTTHALDRHRIAKAAQRLLEKLPRALRHDPDAQMLARLCDAHGVDVVHLIYRSKHYESQSKDYEFSRLSVREHWATGLADTTRTLRDPRWTQREAQSHGVRVFDLASGERSHPQPA